MSSSFIGSPYGIHFWHKWPIFNNNGIAYFIITGNSLSTIFVPIKKKKIIGNIAISLMIKIFSLNNCRGLFHMSMRLYYQLTAKHNKAKRKPHDHEAS